MAREVLQLLREDTLLSCHVIKKKKKPTIRKRNDDHIFAFTRHVATLLYNNNNNPLTHTTDCMPIGRHI